jgi:hypothetical protein
MMIFVMISATVIHIVLRFAYLKIHGSMFVSNAYDQIGEVVDEGVVLTGADAEVFEHVLAPAEDVVLEDFVGDAAVLVFLAFGDQQVVLVLFHALVVAVDQQFGLAFLGKDLVFALHAVVQTGLKSVEVGLECVDSVEGVLVEFIVFFHSA